MCGEKNKGLESKAGRHCSVSRMGGRLLGSAALGREAQGEIIQEGRDDAEKLDFSPMPKSYWVISGKEMISSGLSLKDLLCV